MPTIVSNSVPQLEKTDRLVIKVLVLDDNYGDFDAIRRALSRMESYSVNLVRAETIEEARHALAVKSFDIALIDYNLGMETGIRIIHELGGRGADVVPIVVTGLPDASVQDNALSAGAVGIVNKSDISPRLLETTIRTALYSHNVETRLQAIISSMATKYSGNVNPADGDTKEGVVT